MLNKNAFLKQITDKLASLPAVARMLFYKGKKTMNQEEKNPQTDNLNTDAATAENTIADNNETDTPSDANLQLADELANMQDKYLRLMSEFENYKKRNSKERIELLKTASKDLIIDLLPVLDDFERGMQSMQTSTDVKSVLEGVTLIYNKLNKTLTNKGLAAMETIGQPFDAELHEAVSQMPAPTQEQKHVVLFEAEKGYRLNDHVIRYAKVIVGV